MKNTQHRIIYAKGGNAVTEGTALFDRAGEVPKGGPDQFLLSVLHTIPRQAQLRLYSIGQQARRLSKGRLEAIELNARPVNSGKFKRALSFLSANLRFASDVIAWRPGTVISGLEGYFGAVAAISARLCGARFVFSVHNALENESVTTGNRIANGVACKLAHHVLVHGPFLRDQVSALTSATSKIIEYNSGVDTSVIDQLISAPQPEDRTIQFVYVGRVEEDKGALDLLNAFEQVRTKLPCELVYVGEGGALDLLNARAEQSPWRNDIKVLGPMPHRAALEVIHRGAVVVTPTQRRFPEGRCKTAMEAFLLGRPVIAPRFGPFPYLVKDGINGKLYEPDSLNDLAASMQAVAMSGLEYQRLSNGALASGRELRTPQLDFFGAIRAVLAQRTADQRIK